ncbi:MAG: TonB-dependent receptor plug domain-containing protein, partial [Pseudomonadota bacterium]
MIPDLSIRACLGRARRSTLLTCVGTLLACSQTMAADDALTVHITEGRAALPSLDMPGLVTVVDREQIEQSNARNLAELLAGRAGIQLTDLFGDGTQTSVDMRGFGPTASSNILILVDGRRLNNNSDVAAPAINRVRLDQIERIEIVRGSAGVLFGNQAVGGVVNVVTRSADLDAHYLEGGVGSYQSARAHAGFSRPLGHDLFLRVAASYRDTDNYRDHNSLRSKDLGLRLEQQYGRGTWFLEGDAANDYQQLPGSLFADEVAGDRRQSAPVYARDFSDTDTLTGRLGISHRFNDNWRAQGEATWRREDREFITSFRTFPGQPATQDRETWTLNPRLVGNVGEGASLTLGLDYEPTDYVLETQFGPQKVDQKIWGIYGQTSV